MECMTTRRTFLAGTAAVLLAGCGGGDGDEPPSNGGGQHCRTPGELVDFDRVGTGTLVYDETGRATSMKIEPKFLSQLHTWSEDWAQLSGLGAVKSVTSLGAYVDKCSSYHQIGQAFDISAIEHEGGDVSLHYDQWQPGSDRQLRDYWRLAASLHLHFSYTLAYSYNEQHHNHIHFDNLVSGSGLTSFAPSSRTQVQLVQHACRHVFGHDVPVSGDYDAQTKDGVRLVQQRAGLTVPLAQQEGWHGFLRAVARG